VVGTAPAAEQPGLRVLRDRLRTGRDRLVDGEHLVGNHRPVVAPHRGLRLGGQPVAQRLVREQPQQVRGQRRVVAHGEQHPQLSAVQHPAEGVEVARQHRRPGAHRLDQHDAEALAAGVRGHVDVDRAQQGRLVGVADLAQELARGE
jgi:hypothetical protein